MIAFLVKLALTNVLFSLVIGAALVRLNKHRSCSTGELILYSMGLGPVLTALVLYYLLLFIPGQPHLFYIIGVLLVYGLIFIFSIKGFQILGVRVKEWMKSSAGIWKESNSREKFKRAIYWGFLLVLLGSFLIVYMGSTLQTPIEHHDALIYGNLGKLYYQQKQVTYSKVMKPAKNGFYFQGSKRPSFSLLLTWEMMLNNEQTNQNPYFDLYFRSISGYFGLLIIGVYFYWLYKKNKYLALLGLLVLFSGYRFFAMMVNYHLDAYRIFFLLVSWIWLAYTLKHKDNFSLFLLGVFSGFAAFTHLIGLVVALFNGLALFIFYEGGLKTRIFKTAALGLLIIALGNIHYLMEVLFGSVSGYISYISY